MQKKKERNEQTKAQIGNGSCMCKMSALLSFLRSRSLVVSLCGCIVRSCSVRLDSLRFLLNWNWQPLAFALACCVCVPRWLSICLGRATFCRCAHIHFSWTFANENFSFMTGCIMPNRSPYSFIHSFTYSCIRSFIHIRICSPQSGRRGRGRCHCQVLLPNTMVTLIDVDWPGANAFVRLVCGQSVSATGCQLPTGHRPHTVSTLHSPLFARHSSPLCGSLDNVASNLLQLAN